MEYHIKDNYYFDIDKHNQLRITGPENHLLMGLAVPKAYPLTIGAYDIVDGRLVVEISIPATEITVPMPLVTDIRSLRQQVEQKKPQPTYQQLVDEGIMELLPRNQQQFSITGSVVISLTNSYLDTNGSERTYGVELLFPPEYEVEMINNHSLGIKSSGPAITVQIRTISTLDITGRPTYPFFAEHYEEVEKVIPPAVAELYQQSKTHIEHLVLNNKTSSFEYGTIFPRDWIESADLGANDLSQETIDYMYEQSMKYVSESGEGWHEEIIGEYKIKLGREAQPVDRKMIDIEPHYLLGIPSLSRRFLFEEANQDKFRRIANYLISQATHHQLITFKQVNPETDDYYPVGNWRDSAAAFPGQKSPLAPYDVNCVFYPQALRVIRTYLDYFGELDEAEINQLIEKWDHHKTKFRLYHDEGLIGYSLALHGRKNIPMPIAHLDESYDLFYGEPTLEEIVSFAKKILDPDFFYTPVGPMLVAADEPDFNSRQYHGKVIWPKQAGFAVAGLTRQYQKGLSDNWPKPVLQTIRKAVGLTAEACFRGWTEINAVPELYYYDENEKRARLFVDQEEYEGQMSLIQLWSSVSCRRIVQDYHFMVENPVE